MPSISLFEYIQDRQTLKLRMAEEKPTPKKTQLDYMSDVDTSDEEINLCLRTSPEETDYGMIPGSTQATQAALSYTRAQTNPMVEHRPPRQPRSRHTPQDTTEQKTPQTKTDKESK